MAHGSKHPHVRGEDLSIPSALSPSSETPPRAWGRHINGGHNNFRIRNTPTCVGKTEDGQAPETSWWKHPHVRGEDVLQCILNMKKSETPPRAWGRQRPLFVARMKARNTPTCVGKTTYPCSMCILSLKHPHVRGEDSFPQTAFAVQSETPPRAWGRRLQHHQSAKNDGNTPTCVGKTHVKYLTQ